MWVDPGATPVILRSTMGLGIDGPIGDLAGFALSRALRVVSNRTNKAKAQCKGCGAHLAKGEGREVQVEGLRVGQASYPYFCPQCFGVVWAANQKYPTMDPAVLDGLGPGAEGDEAGSLSPEELDRRIRERETEAK